MFRILYVGSAVPPVEYVRYVVGHLKPGGGRGRNKFGSHKEARLV